MDLFGDYTLRVVALGSSILGATGGALGSFAVLRRQSLLGDTLSHAALPGIAIAFLLTASKAPLIIMLGAAAAGWVGTVFVRLIVRRTRVPADSALGLVLSVFFGAGLVLLTLIQKRPDAAQAGLETFLFGQAAALLRADLVVMVVLGGIALVILTALWKQFKLLTFDAEFGASLGLSMGRFEGLLTALLVIAVVIGLQTVGVVLMSAMIVAPGAAARQWTDRLGVMVALAAGFGVLSGVVGAVLSSAVPKLPTGPTIVLILSAVVIASLLFAPARGLVWRRIRLGRARRDPRPDPVLMHLYALAMQHPDDPDHGHGVAVLRTMSSRDANVPATLEVLERRRLVARREGDSWALTDLGRRQARRILERETGGAEEL